MTEYIANGKPKQHFILIITTIILALEYSATIQVKTTISQLNNKNVHICIYIQYISL